METTATTTRTRESRDEERHGFGRALSDVTREHGFEPLRVEGRIPDELKGTLYRNGPGLFSAFGHHYEHLFDGDGLISAVRFANGEAQGGVRLLETPGRMEERRRGKAYFGVYGTSGPGPFNPVRTLRKLRGVGKNPANTAVLAWDDCVFGLCEAGKPFELDPGDLTSIGETDLGGAIPHAFSAHPHRLASNGYIYNIGQHVTRPAELDVMVLRPDGTAGRLTTIPLDFATMIDDFVLTESAVIVFVAPLPLRLLRTLFGMGSYAENLQWEPERGTEVIVIPFDAPLSPIRFRVEPFWMWHVGNAFTRGDEVVFDMVRYESFGATNDWLYALSRGSSPNRDADGYLGRARLNVKKRSLDFERTRPNTGEFPRIAPAVEAEPSRVIYWQEHSSKEVGRRGFPDTVVRVDMESGATDSFRCEDGQMPSEGVFVPRPGSTSEDDGWLVSLVYDPRIHASHWAIFDAAHIADGPIARAHLDHHVPPTFHGTWVPA